MYTEKFALSKGEKNLLLGVLCESVHIQNLSRGKNAMGQSTWDTCGLEGPP